MNAQGDTPPQAPKFATCICEGAYSWTGALVWGERYEVLGVNAFNGNIRVRGHNGRTRWFPDYCFDTSGSQVVRILSFSFDDPIEDPECNWVDISIEFSDGSRRCCTVSTGARIAQSLSPERYPSVLKDRQGHPFRMIAHLPYTILVSRLTEDVMDATLYYLERQNELFQTTWLVEKESDEDDM
jgi:hypothetical protein